SNMCDIRAALSPGPISRASRREQGAGTPQRRSLSLARRCEIGSAGSSCPEPTKLIWPAPEPPLLLLDQRQYVVGRDDFVVLVVYDRIPADFAVHVGLWRRDLLGRERDPDAVARRHRPDEAQVLEPVV